MLLNARDKDKDGAFSMSAKRIGGPLLFGRLWEQSGVADVLGEVLKDRAFEFAVERAVFAATLHRLFVFGIGSRLRFLASLTTIFREPMASPSTISIAPWPGSAKSWKSSPRVRWRRAASRT